MIEVLNFSSTEMIRGSFCYSAYLAYSALKSRGENVLLRDNITAIEIGELDNSKHFIGSVWSYPQIETALYAKSVLSNIQFVGYLPFLKKYRLPVWQENYLKEGIANLPDIYNECDGLLVDDSDFHLKKYQGTLYPAFLSYGCKNGCSFCPVNVNTKRIIKLSKSERMTVLDAVLGKTKNIHFEDEDFLRFVSQEELEFLSEKEANYVCLSTVKSLANAINTFGTDLLLNSGLKVAELGLESGDVRLREKMCKVTSKENYLEEILQETRIDKLWLVVSFFPGETLETLKTTGDFLRKYGRRMEEMVPKMWSVSTPLGLGQFFLPYEGVKGKDIAEGLHLTERPIRLIPSFIPDSLLNQEIKKEVRIPEDIQEVLKKYNINENKIQKGVIRDIIRGDEIDRIITISVMARAGKI